jgi:hypothetical protein
MEVDDVTKGDKMNRSRDDQGTKLPVQNDQGRNERGRIETLFLPCFLSSLLSHVYLASNTSSCIWSTNYSALVFTRCDRVLGATNLLLLPPPPFPLTASQLYAFADYWTTTIACHDIHASQLSCLKPFAKTFAKNIDFCKKIYFCIKNMKFYKKYKTLQKKIVS